MKVFIYLSLLILSSCAVSYYNRVSLNNLIAKKIVNDNLNIKVNGCVTGDEVFGYDLQVKCNESVNRKSIINLVWPEGRKITLKSVEHCNIAGKIVYFTEDLVGIGNFDSEIGFIEVHTINCN